MLGISHGTVILILVLIRQVKASRFTSPDTQPCEPDWELHRQEVVQARRRWVALSSPCYSYTFLDYAQRTEYFVQVLDGLVISQKGKTMEQIFSLILKKCYRTCPDSGPVSCDVTYAADGSITSALIDFVNYSIGDEIYFEIPDLTSC